MFYRKKDLLEKAATIKRFEYLPLGSELKQQTSIAEKQYKRLDNTYELDKIIKKEQPTVNKYNRSNLVYCQYGFNGYYDIRDFNNLSLKSKYPVLA